MTISGFGYRSVAASPLSVLGSLAWWVRADLGITIATGVSAWADQSGNGRNFAQGTAGLQPALIGSAINGRPALRGDGADDFMNATWARVAPGTQPFYLWMIVKQISWTSGDGICGDFNGASGGIIYGQTGSTPQVAHHNGAGFANTNGGGTIGSYFRHEVQYTNSTADYLKIGAAAPVTGTSAGNNAGSGVVQLFAVGSGSIGSGNVEIAEAFIFLGTPSAPQRASLDAYCTSLYGSGLV